MKWISAEYAHPNILAFRRCEGSDTWPQVFTENHGLCDVCDQPFRLMYGAIPPHRTKQQ